MSRPGLVTVDLDGTLLRSDGTVSPRTRAVLAELDGRGVPVVFTTGRPIRWMEALWDDVGGHGLAVLSNGAVVYDVSTHRVRDVRPVPRQAGLELADLVRADVPGTAFALEHTGGWASEPAFPRHPDDPTRTEQGELAELWSPARDVVKLLAVHAEHEPEDFWRRVEDAAGHLVTTTWSSTFSLVEMSARGVTKATTAESLASELGVRAADVVAFGDMPNDLALLQWAGTSYAMANAHPSVLEVADRVAPANDEDGVAAVLEELFGLR